MKTLPLILCKTALATAAALLAAGPALADITIGISLPLTGPASGLGLPMQNQFKLWPATVAGEKLNVIILDDATDPTKGEGKKVTSQSFASFVQPVDIMSKISG